MPNDFTTDLRVLLPTESPREYRKHHAGLVAAFVPVDAYEDLLVEEFAAAAWAWRRARAVEADFLHHVGNSYYAGTAGIAQALFYVPNTHFRNYRAFTVDAERRYVQARRAVEEIRRGRAGGDAARLPHPPETPTLKPSATRVAAVTARAALAKKKRNEAKPSATAPRSGPPATWTELKIRNEPKGAAQTAQPERRGDRAMRRLLEICERQSAPPPTEEAA